MRTPDNIEKNTTGGRRSIKASFVTERISDTKLRQVTLSATHSKERKAFFASLTAETVERTDYGITTSFTLFSGKSVLGERVDRYSAKRLEEFFDRALALVTEDDIAELAAGEEIAA